MDPLTTPNFVSGNSHPMQHMLLCANFPLTSLQDPARPAAIEPSILFTSPNRPPSPRKIFSSSRAAEFYSLPETGTRAVPRQKRSDRAGMRVPFVHRSCVEAHGSELFRASKIPLGALAGPNLARRCAADRWFKVIGPIPARGGGSRERTRRSNSTQFCLFGLDWSGLLFHRY